MSFSVFAMSNELKSQPGTNYTSSPKERPPQLNDECAHIGYALLKKMESLTIHLVAPTNKNLDSQVSFPEDGARIKKIFGKSIEEFEKKYLIHSESIEKFLLEKLATLREKGSNSGFGGLRGTEIKKWKFLIKLDRDKHIENIFLGRFYVSGSYTKVYLTLDNKAILVPRKDSGKEESANQQLTQAHRNCLKIFLKYSQKKNHSDVIQKLLVSLELSKNNFTDEKKLILSTLPPTPEMFPVNNRPVMVLPKGMPATVKFNYPPKYLFEIIERIKILRDVALGVALFHAERMVHGDIKPDNLLINYDGIGQLHDLGGCDFFETTDNSETAIFKYQSLMTSTLYTHYQDAVYYKKFRKTKPTVDYFLELGKSRDVFALGVTTIQAMIGFVDLSGKKQFPYQNEAYISIPHKTYRHYYIIGDVTKRTEISCIKAISPEIDLDFQELLDQALHHNYMLRLPINDLVLGLDRVWKNLKECVP
jgi:serine/threonine protein kinase